MNEPEVITKETAADAARAAAFTTEDGETILHCFIGGLGADWLLVGVLDQIESAYECGWVDNLFSHDLTVISADRKIAYSFDVPRPAVTS